MRDAEAKAYAAAAATDHRAGPEIGRAPGANRIRTADRHSQPTTMTTTGSASAPDDATTTTTTGSSTAEVALVRVTTHAMGSRGSADGQAHATGADDRAFAAAMSGAWAR